MVTRAMMAGKMASMAKKATPAASRETLSSFTSALTRLRTANHPRGGISLGRSASLPAARASLRWVTSRLLQPRARRGAARLGADVLGLVLGGVGGRRGHLLGDLLAPVHRLLAGLLDLLLDLIGHRPQPLVLDPGRRHSQPGQEPQGSGPDGQPQRVLPGQPGRPPGGLLDLAPAGGGGAGPVGRPGHGLLGPSGGARHRRLDVLHLVAHRFLGSGGHIGLVANGLDGLAHLGSGLLYVFSDRIWVLAHSTSSFTVSMVCSGTGGVACASLALPGCWVAMLTSGLSRQRVGVAAAAREVVRRGDWRDGLASGVVGARHWWDYVGLGERGFGAEVGAGVGRVGGGGGPRGRSSVVPARGVRPVGPVLVAAAAGGLQEPRGGEAQGQAAGRDQPGLAAGEVLNVAEQPLAVGVAQVGPE